MRKYIRFIGKSFLWLLYLMITAKQRNIYNFEKANKVKVLELNNGFFSDEYIVERHLKNEEQPTRNFMTWSEFRKTHNF